MVLGKMGKGFMILFKGKLAISVGKCYFSIPKQVIIVYDEVHVWYHVNLPKSR
jgi:hypothetical protein